MRPAAARVTSILVEAIGEQMGGNATVSTNDQEHPAESGPRAEPTEVPPEQVEVDGVPVLLAPRTGQVTGGLVFRVGVADETLATRGITHLVEHLAMSPHHSGQEHSNAETADRWTLFHATGTLEEVGRFLNDVCAALRELPLERIEVEKKILRTEAAGREGSTRRIHRYGAAGYGLAAFTELGLPRLTEDEVGRWARERLNGGNAVAFLTAAELPDGLDLRLPPGPRQPDPDPGQIVPITPAYALSSARGIALDAIVARSSAAVVFVRAAARSLFQTLRTENGYSYVADAAYDPRDSTHVTITLVADALEDQQEAMVAAFLAVVQRLGSDDLLDEEVARAKETTCASLITQGPADLLPGQAISILSGQPVQTGAALLEELEAVSVDDVRRVAREVWDNALIVCPGTSVAAVAAAVVVPARPPIELSLKGQTFKRAGQLTAPLILGDDAASLITGEPRTSVRYADCQAMLSWPDGGRCLIGRDGRSIDIEPGMYAGLYPKIIARLVDTRIDPARVIALPARDKSQIPRFGAKETIVFVVMALLIGIGGSLLVSAVVAGFTDGFATGFGLSVLATPFCIAAAWMITARVRKNRSRRQ